MTDNHRVRPLSSGIWRLASVAGAAIRIRFRPSSPIALVHAATAMFDVLVYAAVVYFIVDIVFLRRGFERFELILVGFIAFSWSVRSMLEARRFPELRDRMGEACDRPVAATVAACLAPPTFTFLISLAIAVAIEVAVLGTGARLAMAAWLVPTVLIHFIWNVALLLALGIALARRWIDGVVPAVLIAGLVWMLSPVMYRFEDIPAPANPLLTSLNPASHILAAYHNALWRAEPMSLQVLPAAGVLGIVFVAWLARRAAPPPAVDAGCEGARGALHFIAVCGGAAPSPGAGRVFRRWRGDIAGLTGENLAALIMSARGAASQAGVAQIGEASRIGRLFRDALAVYPSWALAQLAFATAMDSGEPALALDGLLDEVQPAYLAEAWSRIEHAAASGRRVTVISYIAISPPQTAKGTFDVIGPDGQRRSGAIGPELEAAYAALRGEPLGSLPAFR